MPEVNEHGLSRYIPADVKREVRQRSKFGCVICRRGFYQYEHIDPPFADAKTHDAEGICCLCGSCHDAVTRKQHSKDYVKAEYKKIQGAGKIDPPIGPLDFHDGHAELKIGGLFYSPVVRTVLRYHGSDIIRVEPGIEGEPGQISAVFTDHQGEVTLQLVNNEWIGALNAWDIEVVGQRITVRRKQGEVALQLRLDPPGCIVIERLDMRFQSCHLLVSEETYAVGRYIRDGVIHWAHVGTHILSSSPVGAAIEFTDAQTLEERDARYLGRGQELATHDRGIVISSNAGVMIKSLGIAVASQCGAIGLYGMAVSGGPLPLEEMRKIVFSSPKDVCRFIGTGKTS